MISKCLKFFILIRDFRIWLIFLLLNFSLSIILLFIFVDAKKKEINKRLKKKHTSNHKFLRKFQLPVEVKKEKSDFVVKNNFRSNSIKKNVNIVKQKILLNVRSYT